MIDDKGRLTEWHKKGERRLVEIIALCTAPQRMQPLFRNAYAMLLLSLCLLFAVKNLISTHAYTASVVTSRKSPVSRGAHLEVWKRQSSWYPTKGHVTLLMEMTPKGGWGCIPRTSAVLESGAIPVVGAVLALATYHLLLILTERRSSSTSPTWRSYQADTREEWARYVRKKEGWLYALQVRHFGSTSSSPAP